MCVSHVILILLRLMSITAYIFNIILKKKFCVTIDQKIGSWLTAVIQLRVTLTGGFSSQKNFQE